MTEDRDYPRVTRFVQDSVWAILPSTLDTIVDVVRLRASGARLSAEEIRARLGGASPPTPTPTDTGAVAVIPVFGVIAHRMNMMTEISGGTSTEGLTQAIRQAADSALVEAIVLDVDSPGGSVLGMQEAAEEIYRASTRKRVVAIANATAASGAYWLASQAGELVVTPSGQVGSIGAMALHEDLSQAAAKAGVRVEYITAPSPAKAEGMPFLPLTAEGRAAMQARVEQYYDAFVADVARGRGVDAKRVRGGFGLGRVVSAQDALRAGMVDRIETFDAVLAALRGADAGVRIAARAIAGPGAGARTLGETSALVDDLARRRQLEDPALSYQQALHLVRDAEPELWAEYTR
jgi:signal peptide peptidase SppA